MQQLNARELKSSGEIEIEIEIEIETETEIEIERECAHQEPAAAGPLLVWRRSERPVKSGQTGKLASQEEVFAVQQQLKQGETAGRRGSQGERLAALPWAQLQARARPAADLLAPRFCDPVRSGPCVHGLVVYMDCVAPWPPLQPVLLPAGH